MILEIFKRNIITEIAKSLKISFDEAEQVIAPQFLEKIDDLYCKIKFKEAFDKFLNLFRNVDETKNANKQIKTAEIIDSITFIFGQQLELAKVPTSSSLKEKIFLINKLKNEAMEQYLSQKEGFENRVSVERSLWKSEELNQKENSVVLSFFKNIALSSDRAQLTDIYYKTNSFSKYVIDQFEKLRLNINPLEKKENLANRVFKNYKSELKKIKQLQEIDYLKIKFSHVLKSIFFNKTRKYYTLQKESLQRSIDFHLFLIKLKLQKKINISRFEIDLCKDTLEKIQERFNEESAFTLEVKNELKKNKELHEKYMLKQLTLIDKEIIPLNLQNEMQSINKIINNCPNTHFERTFFKQMEVYHKHSLNPHKQILLIDPYETDIDVSSPNAQQEMMQLIENQDLDCLRQSISIEEI